MGHGLCKIMIFSLLFPFLASSLADGQTGSGKTHTMEGTLPDPGVTVRAVRYLFAAAAARTALMRGGGGGGSFAEAEADGAAAADDAADGLPARPMHSTSTASAARGIDGSLDGAAARVGADAFAIDRGRDGLAPVPAHAPARAAAPSRRDGLDYSISLSMMEIYQEHVRDLLAGVTRAADVKGHGSAASGSGRGGSTSSVSTFTWRPSPVGASALASGPTFGGGAAIVDPSDLQCRETAAGVEVVGLTRLAVASAAEALEVIRLGAVNRAVGGHALNAHSSRSHMVVRLWVEGPAPAVADELQAASAAAADQRQGQGAGHGQGFGFAAASPFAFTAPRRVAACVNLVDLAGSERVARTGAEGERLREATSINGSLSVLGAVIAALRKASNQSQGRGTSGAASASASASAPHLSHVPFRDSKLTFTLKDALTGGARVLMLACVSPDPEDVGETVNTLAFAARCRATALGAAARNIFVPGTLASAPVAMVMPLQQQAAAAAASSAASASARSASAIRGRPGSAASASASASGASKPILRAGSGAGGGLGGTGTAARRSSSVTSSRSGSIGPAFAARRAGGIR